MEKKWPWVSRELHDYTKKVLEERVSELNQERLRLLDLLLEGGVDKRVPVAERAAVPVEAEPRETQEPNPDQGTPVSYSTPFDRLESRFSTAFKNGAIPLAYKARVN